MSLDELLHAPAPIVFQAAVIFELSLAHRTGTRKSFDRGKSIRHGLQTSSCGPLSHCPRFFAQGFGFGREWDVDRQRHDLASWIDDIIIPCGSTCVQRSPVARRFESAGQGSSR
jgi:hypothetical protein